MRISCILDGGRWFQVCVKLLLLLTQFLPPAHPQAAAPRAFRLEELKTLPGYEVSVYAAVGGTPRHMAFGPNGVLYVAARNGGNIVTIPERGRTVVALRGLAGPHTLQFRDGDLWVAVNNGVLRYRDAVTADLVIRSSPERIATVPAGGGHSTRTLGFGPDGKLYVSIGSTCNFCNEEEPRRATLVRFDADGSNETIFARGLRNTVGFAWNPTTGKLWGVDHGGDNLGDDEPPEEINLIEEGADYGWPDCVGDRRPVRWGAGARTERCAGTRGPALQMQAHAAPLGISFYQGDEFPASFQGDALIAYHGSWNRSQPAGYKVTRVRVADGQPVSEEDFLWGFLDLTTRSRSGRPVQAIPGPDGAIYVSDDGNSNIYRVEYKGPRINPGGVVRAVDNVFSIYGKRLTGDPALLQVFGNGLALEVLYAAEDQINFVLPPNLSGRVTIQVKTERAVDESIVQVD